MHSLVSCLGFAQYPWGHPVSLCWVHRTPVSLSLWGLPQFLIVEVTPVSLCVFTETQHLFCGVRTVSLCAVRPVSLCEVHPAPVFTEPRIVSLWGSPSFSLSGIHGTQIFFVGFILLLSLGPPNPEFVSVRFTRSLCGVHPASVLGWFQGFSWPN